MKEKVKLVALGDSILKGVLCNQENDGRIHYSLSDSNVIDRVASTLRMQALNLCKMGCTIGVGESILNRYKKQVEDAKFVLLSYGGNDGDYDWQSIADSPNSEHHPRTSLTMFENTYIDIINTLRGIGCVPIVLSLTPMNTQSYFNFITRQFSDVRKTNVFNWLNGSLETIAAGHEEYNGAVKRVAKATNAPLIDITLPLENHAGCLCVDGIHPNVYGQALIADIVSKNIAQFD